MRTTLSGTIADVNSGVHEITFIPTAFNKHPVPINCSSGSSSMKRPDFVMCIGPSICVPVCIPHVKRKLLNPSRAKSLIFSSRVGSSPGYTGMRSMIGCERSMSVWIDCSFIALTFITFKINLSTYLTLFLEILQIPKLHLTCLFSNDNYSTHYYEEKNTQPCKIISKYRIDCFLPFGRYVRV